MNFGDERRVLEAKISKRPAAIDRLLGHWQSIWTTLDYRIPDTGYRPRARASRAVLCIFIRRNDGWQRSRGTRFALNDRFPFSALLSIYVHTRYLHAQIYIYIYIYVSSLLARWRDDRFAREKIRDIAASERARSTIIAKERPKKQRVCHGGKEGVREAMQQNRL